MKVVSSLVYAVLIFKLGFTFGKNSDPDPARTITWGPGLRPADVVLPVHYFFVQLVNYNGKNLTKTPTGRLDIFIGNSDSIEKCRVQSNILNRNDGSFIVQYKVYQVCNKMIIDLRYENIPIAGFPLVMNREVLSDSCVNCPKDFFTWRSSMHCPSRYEQMQEDLKPFVSVNMDIVRPKVLLKFNKSGSMSFCHYVVLSNKIHRTCYGKYVGFHVFMDSILLSLARKVKLPNVEFFVNLGDWPLEHAGPEPLPIFSWCGSDKTADIVMPTYDLTESTLECMGRVQLDMLSVQGNTGPPWHKKQPIAFWRGRDARQERLDLVEIARAHPHLLNASLTNFFFFRDKEAQYGPKQPHISFFKFFEYKYQISIDGTVAAYRLPYLLAGDSLVLKQDSTYYEHFYRDLKPWEHFVPIARNLSDLVEKIEWARSNDSSALRIARNGALYTRENLMPVHIFCYYALLLEEWNKRLSSNIRVIPEMEVVPQPDSASTCECGTRHEEL